MRSIKDMKPIGVKALTNTMSLCVYEVDASGDYLYAGVPGKLPKKYKCYQSVEKGAYFNWGKTRNYLSEFMRVP